MQSLIAVAVMLALAIGLPPRGHAFDAPYLSQTIPQIATQSSCPTLLELDAGPSTPVQVNVVIDGVWTRIRDALGAWAKDSVSRDSGSGVKRVLRTDATLIVEQPSAQAPLPSAPFDAVGRTCFYEWRTENTDTRMAFKFSARAGRGRAPGSEVEIRWLSQMKGSAQRTWRSTRADSGLLNSLLERLSRGSGN
jgi:hypothetical protein